MTDSGLLDGVREACRAVAEQAVHVTIDEKAVEPYAASLPPDRIQASELDPARHYLGHGEDTLIYLLCLDTVNFGSGYFPYLRKIKGLSGYFTVATNLKKHFEDHGPFAPEDLKELRGGDCARIFGQDPDGGPRTELMGLFASALRELGRYVLERFEGRFSLLVESAGESAEKLVEILAGMSRFRDRALYRGMEVPFYKRAQIAASDLSLAFRGEGYGRFRDLDRLTIFADNLVPHVLRVDGILAYSSSLAARIDGEELLTSGSPEEVEIRACGLHAVELISRCLRNAGTPAPPMKLDSFLWNRGQQPFYKARPRHRCRSIFY